MGVKRVRLAVGGLWTALLGRECLSPASRLAIHFEPRRQQRGDVDHIAVVCTKRHDEAACKKQNVLSLGWWKTGADDAAVLWCCGFAGGGSLGGYSVHMQADRRIRAFVVWYSDH